MSKRFKFGWVGLALVLFTVAHVSPTEARGFKVYGYKTPDQGEVELVYWLDYFADGIDDRDELLRHSVEIEYGVTDRWTISYYADFEDPKGKAFKYVQSRAVFLRYRLFEPGDRFFDTAIYLEYYIPRQSTPNDKEKLESRIILEKNLEIVKVKLNPTFSKILGGKSVAEGIEFEYGAGVYLKEIGPITPGIEFFGEMGEIGHLPKPDDQEHFIFPVIKAHLPMHMEIDTGVGFGLTSNSDDVIVKAILSYEYD